MKRLFKFKYPKLALLLVCVIIAYFIFRNPFIANFILSLGKLRYLGLFIAGIFFAFGFLAPLAAGFFISYNPINLWLAAIVAGIGVMVSNLIIFNFIKVSFEDEFRRLEKSKTARRFSKFIGKEIGTHIKVYLLYIFAGIVIASPLPDEVGVIMLSGLARINQFVLAILTFVLGTLGVAFLLYI